jgi:hypothetical protein
VLPAVSDVGEPMKNKPSTVRVLALGWCLGTYVLGQSYTINTIAGIYPTGDSGAATAALLVSPANAAVDGNGNVYFADFGNHKIRKVTPSGQISTIAGTGFPGFSGDGKPATAAQLYNPSAVALDSAGNVYIYDTYNYRIRKVSTSGIITTIAGGSNGNGAGDNGSALQAQVAFVPGGSLVLDASGNVYIAGRLPSPQGKSDQWHYHGIRWKRTMQLRRGRTNGGGRRDESTRGHGV